MERRSRLLAASKRWFSRLEGGARLWSRASWNLVVAQHCACCRLPIAPDGGIWLCEDCLAKLETGEVVRCLRCGLPCTGLSDAAGCGSCRRVSLKFDRVFPLGSYDGELRAAVLRLKRPRQEALARSLAELLGRRVEQHLPELRPEAVLPIPMHWLRRLKRGVNCPELLAEVLAGKLGLPLLRGLLRRRRNTQIQGDLSPRQRFENIRGAFRVRKSYHLEAARVLLVDDVLTTGATCSEAAKVLRQAGAASVLVAVLARTRPPE